MENYDRGKLLGKGSFGSAWLCVSKVDSKQYVIKEVDISRMPRAEKEGAEQEAKVSYVAPELAIQLCVYCHSAQKVELHA